MKKKNGFTLVELLAVIVILAVIITIASTSVNRVTKKARGKAAEEMRGNLKDAALTYSFANFHMDKCSVTFSEEVFLHNNISNLEHNLSCAKKITVNTLLEEGLFKDSKGYCNKNEEIIIYRYNDGDNSEYKVYISEKACES